MSLFRRNLTSTLFFSCLLLLTVTGCSCGDDGPTTPPTPNEFEVSQLPYGFVAVPFAEQAPILGGDGPYTLVEVLDGAPDWLAVSVDTGRDVTLAGTPDATGEHIVRLRLQDSREDRDIVEVRLVVLATGDLSLVGNWQLSVDVTVTTGELCAGEENDPVAVYQVLIGQFGNSVTITGDFGSSGATLSGKIYPWDVGISQVVVSGSYAEDGGVTTVESYRLFLHPEGHMDGYETWTWDFASQHCTGQSDLMLTRVP